VTRAAPRRAPLRRWEWRLVAPTQGARHFCTRTARWDPGRPSLATCRSAQSDPKETFVASNRTAGNDGYRSLMGQGREALRGVDAFGCLRSLRARSALDGVSWVQRGSVEIAVGQRLAPATESAPCEVQPSAEERREASSWNSRRGRPSVRVLNLGGETVDTKSATSKLIRSPSSPASRVRTRNDA
jgi:hypothetical protein